MISSEHKKCHKFPITKFSNLEVDDIPLKKFDEANKINELQNSEATNNSILTEQRSILTTKKQIAKEYFKKLSKSNITLLEQWGNVLFTTVVVLIIAIMIALLLQLFAPQSHITNTNQKNYVKSSMLHDLSINTAPEISLLDFTNMTKLGQVTQVTEHNSSIFNEQNVEIIYTFNETKKQGSDKQNFNDLQQQTTLNHKMLNINNQQYYQLKSWLMNELSDNVTPVILRLDDFTKKVQEKDVWYSSPFLAFEGGYQMCLKVYAAGYDDGEGTHVSVFLNLMKGPHDDKLEQSGHWPLRGTFTIELLNQLNDVTHLIQFHYHQCSGKCTDRVVEGVVANAGYGTTKFVSLDTFLHKNPFSLVFRVSYENSEPPYQVSPVTFKVTHFSQWLRSKEEWGSSPFLTFDGGYQMHLIVHPADKCEGTHVSVYLGLMKGPHDDKLEQSSHWPLRGTFTIELLNQLNDSDHYGCQVQFHHHICSECTNRVLEEAMAYRGYGHAQFISHDVLHHSDNSYYINDSLIFKISYEHMEPSYQVAPVIFKVTKFSQWLKSKEKWYSSPFFAFNEGYQLCLQVDADGHGDGEGTHVSVYLHLMKGPHDDKLEQSGHWPLRGTFTIELLNLFNDSDHYSHTVQFHNYLCSEYSDRVSEVMACTGCGCNQFISHNTLLYYNSSHIRNDFLIFRIFYEDMEPPYQVMPVSFKLKKFSQWLKSKEEWYSSPFFAFDQGYQVCLNIYASGYGNGKGTHVSVYMYLMKGPHDDKLEQSGHWPLRGTFTIELLNQLNDSDHYSRMIQFHHLLYECSNRVSVEVIANSGCGQPQFISHSTLLDHSGSKYYKSDSVIFRVSYKDTSRTLHQEAPVTFKVTQLSQWLRSKDVWYSNPFFTFHWGHQMCLKVHAAGYGDGEGTHVSVFLYLIKGPYDDKLEQSGHWPLRGTFTIELVNQLNDSNHYSHIVQFHHHLCKDCTNRVLVGMMSNSGCGETKFISHHTLFHYNNSSYYKSDSVIFRISYEDSEAFHQVAPVTFKVTQFSQWVKSKKVWYSSPFFAFDEGYQMHLKVYPADEIKDTDVSVYFYLMKGPHDDKLEQSGHWPLRGTFTIELLNQLNDSDHYSLMVQFHHYWCSECTNRVLKEVIANSGHGKAHFISYDTLLHNGFHRNDSLIFRISYEHVEPPNQVAPVIFKVSKFSKWVKNKEIWYSNPFFAFEEGYQMYLKVHAADEGTHDHVSVYLFLMKGPHDDKLEQSGHWPLRGTFTIELLNQFNDSDHYSHMVQFHHHWCNECTNRVLAGNVADSGKGQSHFISHETFLHHNDNSYYRDDSFIFRVSYEGMEPSNQIAPVTFKLGNFTLWVKTKEVWLSSPFFAFTEGYQMFLSVEAAGNDEGTHVSVFLYLMKGPYDDELEQSGHWPLRGRFTIELLNQLNDSDHYSPTVMYIPSSSDKRMYGDKIDAVEVAVEFISHDTLFKHDGYLKDDTLYFRISYFTNNNGIKGHFIIY